MILQTAWQKSFGFLGSKPIVVEPAEEHLTSDAGLLPIRQFDEQIGLTAECAAHLAIRDSVPSSITVSWKWPRCGSMAFWLASPIRTITTSCVMIHCLSCLPVAGRRTMNWPAS